ncbi:GntR family transcriptional regulator [Prauserella marina]|uniref:DNA-binding transcriptional regulator, FadR family n=1 Tax=Prauserella marina TaxID=530584 RepID=A0A222VQ50_9PSEU|nr:FCD domain-containing protein [Prauserella marina]ASR35851.1 GntR family transcriptional regulator [Prauserella marina]PWV84236.1 DNA-binding FadR family transcriptional regulator [Prauserella marina]SDC27366.1 DNA-binding transcriptional regulator, FadR family [Prauserella marina]
MSAYSGRGVHGQTVSTLGARIVSGEIAESDVIDLAALGQDLDVSMTALREAIKVLAAKGLVEARQKRGTYVRAREHWNLLDADVIRWRSDAGDTAAVLHDLAEVRAVVEPAAAAMAALRRDDRDLAELEAALAEMVEAVGAGAAAEVAADLRWHRALLRATHNEMLARMDVFIEPALRLRDVLVHTHSADDPVPSHAVVVDAIRLRDPDAASAAVTALLDKAAQDVAGVIDEPDERETHSE